ncbi:hypothetical protein LA080_004583 [Diaporthe eres]|nr:hypothetical protein LA080_004583 [Diaporthe eres]
MDKKAMGPSLSQEKNEKWMSMPASSPRDNTQEAQAQTQDSFQPPEYFNGGERTISPPPVSLEKDMDPSLCSHLDNSQLDSSLPDTSDASSTSFLSRSSTLNSFSTVQTQDSDTTLCSQSNPSSDDTVSVPRSLTFPAMRPYAVDRKSLPNGASIRMVEQHTVFPFPTRVPGPMIQSSSGLRNTYLTWPVNQGQETPILNSQTIPSRHLTFPMERPRTPTNVEDTQSSVSQRNEERKVPDSPGLGNPLPQDVATSRAAVNAFRQEMSPDEPEFRALQIQTDMFLKSRLTASEQWMIGFLDSKQAGFHCQASTVASSEVTMEPKDFRADEPGTPAEEIQGSRSPSPSLKNKPCGEGNRESSSQDSDDGTGFPHDDCSPENEEDEDFAYDQLVEGITNLVLESSCVGNVEEGAVPVELYVHNFLEQILNHPKPATKSQTLCLPIRNIPVQDNEAASDAGEPGMRGRGQNGNGGSSGGNKRKNKEAPAHSRNGGYGDEDGLDDSSEDWSNNLQEDKKQKIGRNGGKLSCPFRKRNPIRFNVRDHGSCALNGFADLALLKRHIKTSHQKRNGSTSCVRCKETFADQAALKHHLIQPEGCSLRTPTGNEDPEDGITEEVEQALKERRKVNNVGSWESLWELLFPQDPSDRIPDPYHDPPVELDEVQEHCYDEKTVCGFVHQQTIDGRKGITDHGFRYIVEALEYCRNKEGHERSKGRRERDLHFLNTVHKELDNRQYGLQAEQTHPVALCNQPHSVAPTHWEHYLNNPLPLGEDINFFSGQLPHFFMPEYGDEFGVNAAQVPAPDLNPSSEDPARHAAPQHAPTVFPYKDMLAQNDRPCPAAEGSAGRSSGPSSQSHDSGYQTSQELQAAALLHQQQLADGARPGDPSWDSFTTAMGDMPSQHASIPGRGPSDLCGVGTGPLMPDECGDAGSNSEEGFSPL